MHRKHDCANHVWFDSTHPYHLTPWLLRATVVSDGPSICFCLTSMNSPRYTQTTCQAMGCVSCGCPLSLLIANCKCSEFSTILPLCDETRRPFPPSTSRPSSLSPKGDRVDIHRDVTRQYSAWPSEGGLFNFAHLFPFLPRMQAGVKARCRPLFTNPSTEGEVGRYQR
jgi:hypothetical protein